MSKPKPAMGAFKQLESAIRAKAYREENKVALGALAKELTLAMGEKITPQHLPHWEEGIGFTHERFAFYVSAVEKLSLKSK